MPSCSRFGVSAAFFAALFVFMGPRPAVAEVVLPDGRVVPLDSMNGETQLFTLFEERGEVGLDWRADANATPDTFSPLCGFRATLLLREAGSRPAVGWYNADPNSDVPPAYDAIFTIVERDVIPGDPGATVTGATIREHPDYAGGAVGFALVTDAPPPHFTESRYSTVCTSCSAPGPWTLALMYRSLVTPNAYYVAFEDGSTSSSSYGNDGDYNDSVFFFEGVACEGEGEACVVEGAVGICAPGLLECDAESGELTCLPVQEATDEVCDGLDNDCDGEADEGDDLCGVGEVCSRGVCSPLCGDSEFQCAVFPFTQCEEGTCIDPRCAGMECGAGQACIEGECRAPCDGVRCPVGRECRLGACVDPCEGVTCGEMRVCAGGACVLDCECTGCPADTVCDVDSGGCVSAGCDDVQCAAHEFCEEGACADRCRDARCPAGEVCEAGACVLAPPGAEDGGMGDAGAGGDASRDGGAAADAAAAEDAGGESGAGDAGGMDAGGDVGGEGADTGESSGGCSCRSHGSSPPAGSWLTLLGAAWLGARRTRVRGRAVRRS